MMDDGERRSHIQAFVQSASESVNRHPSSVIVFDSAFTSDYFSLTAEVEFDDLMVHLIEPGDLLPEERGGREAEDREVRPTLVNEPGN